LNLILPQLLLSHFEAHRTLHGLATGTPRVTLCLNGL
jgi:hypothetical protein